MNTTAILNYYETTEGRIKNCSSEFALFFQDFLGPEEAALLASESPDAEFEGLGDYEESIRANWRQPKGKGDAGESDI